jgi:YD repeat-containing protein
MKILDIKDMCSEEGLDNGYIHRTFYKSNLETWTLFDKKGRLLHNVISDGRETWQKYNEFGQITYAKDLYKDGTIFEQHWEYDWNGKAIKFYNSNGYEYNYNLI